MRNTASISREYANCKSGNVFHLICMACPYSAIECSTIALSSESNQILEVNFHSYTVTISIICPNPGCLLEAIKNGRRGEGLGKSSLASGQANERIESTVPTISRAHEQYVSQQQGVEWY